MLRVTPHRGVTLVHHHGHHAPPAGGRDGDVVEAPASAFVPPRGQRHHRRVVRVVAVVALGGAAAVPTAMEAVERHVGLGVSGDGRGAFVDFVHFAFQTADVILFDAALPRGRPLPPHFAARTAF
ncbi:hypothetical protein PanWU01x14_277200 [Parasponia andersonii]|uniref:Uncharacterized protein n=1 Tax=Parasponia andersonii TaxID=3476 RepID=A0A2P5B2N2_PARAD|nr:hypothetical protein PanWU01x14_277200 [Parasponia andersonii]